MMLRRVDSQMQHHRSKKAVGSYAHVRIENYIFIYTQTMNTTKTLPFQKPVLPHQQLGSSKLLPKLTS